MIRKLTARVKLAGFGYWWEAGLFSLVTISGVLLRGAAVPFYYILFILLAAKRDKARTVFVFVGLSCLGCTAIYQAGGSALPFFLWMWSIYFFTGLGLVLFSYSKRLRGEKYRLEYMKKRGGLAEATGREKELAGQVERINGRVKYLSNMFTAVKQMLRERLDLRDVLELSADMIESATGEQKMLFFTVDEASEVAEVAYSRGVESGLSGRQFPLKEGKVLAKLWGLRDVRLFTRPEEDFAGLVVPKAFSSLLVCPLVVGGEVIGLMLLFDERADCFDSSLVKKIEDLRHHIAMGVRKAVLYHRYEERSITDGLTRLYSRRYFLARAKEEMERATRYKFPLGVVIGDLDHFKECNDEYGHQAGDDVLRSVAQVLDQRVEAPSLVCRYGGEEFAYLLVDYPKKEAEELCEEIRKRMEAKTIPAIKDKAVTISLGLAAYPEHSDELDQLLEMADEALYAAKRGGRNKVVVYTSKKASPKKKEATKSAKPREKEEG